MSETLTALTIAAQHEMVSGDSILERLVDSREAMRAMARHLQEAWDGYDSALSALRCEDDTDPGTSGDAAEEGEDPEAKPIDAVVASSSVPTPEDPNYTVIFTGTSTGDEGFDLQALLKQQEADASATASPTPHFVSELRDVLAHRQAHAQPGLTKQVDHDLRRWRQQEAKRRLLLLRMPCFRSLGPHSAVDHVDNLQLRLTHQWKMNAQLLQLTRSTWSFKRCFNAPSRFNSRIFSRVWETSTHETAVTVRAESRWRSTRRETSVNKHSKRSLHRSVQRKSLSQLKWKHCTSGDVSSMIFSWFQWRTGSVTTRV